MTREQLDHVLLRAGMIDADTLLARIGSLDAALHPAGAIGAWARRRILETQ